MFGEQCVSLRITQNQKELWDMTANTRGAMTVREFLEWSRISRSTFYKEVKEGRIPLKKVGKRSLVLMSDAEAWLEGLGNL